MTHPGGLHKWHQKLQMLKSGYFNQVGLLFWVLLYYPTWATLSWRRYRVQALCGFDASIAIFLKEGAAFSQTGFVPFATNSPHVTAHCLSRAFGTSTPNTKRAWTFSRIFKVVAIFPQDTPEIATLVKVFRYIQFWNAFFTHILLKQTQSTLHWPGSHGSKFVHQQCTQPPKFQLSLGQFLGNFSLEHSCNLLMQIPHKML